MRFMISSSLPAPEDSGGETRGGGLPTSYQIERLGRSIAVRSAIARKNAKRHIRNLALCLNRNAARASSPLVRSFVRPGAVLPSRPCTVELDGAQRRARPAAWPPSFAGLPCRRQCLLTDFRYDRLRPTFLAKIRQKQKGPCKPFLAQIEQLIDQVLLDTTVASQEVRDK
jgi:hypothetical protein